MTTLIDNILDSVKPQDSEINKALKQGKEFKKYQKKITRSLNSKIVEGFSTQPTHYAEKSQNVLDQNKLNAAEVAELEELKKQYNFLQTRVQELQKHEMGTTQTYLDITNPNNKYHNNNINFTQGPGWAYVTNKGTAKAIVNNDILSSISGQNGCPSNIINVSSSGPNYTTPGHTLELSPPVITGTPIQKNQSCGNEGNNVYVNAILPASTQANYTGCYTDNLSAPTMTFIGGAPAPQASIVNGNFSQPAIGNNSYQYITSQSKIPGWNFNAVLVNNSGAWGYPVPYPSGNQCACIQTTQSMSQTLNLGAGSYTLTFFAVGRNCCDGSGQSNPVNIQLNGTTFYSVQPPVSKWTNYSTTFNVTTTGNNVLSFVGTWSAGDRSTAFQNISISGGANSAGSYTYSMCKEAAISGGYRYFALQNVNTQTSKGYCAVSNNSVGATSNGISYVVSGGFALWASGTYGKSGCSAILTTQGALSVVQNGTSIFATPNSNSNPSNYLGCYGDGPNRAMPLYNGGSQQYSYAQCQAIAQQTKSAYFGLQNSSSGTNAQCALSNNLGQTMGYGKAGNCTRIGDGTYSGGGWSNAVYNNSQPTSNYFLILQDDGNLCIYRGSGPNDNQGYIWCAMTNGKQQKPNPQYTASKGKYGRNYITSGATLAVGDFVGSNDGSTYLIMQGDGNLVLYTSENTLNCNFMADNNIGGGVGANALYDLGKTGFPSNVGKIGFVDDDGNLSEYPSSMKGMSTSYIKFPNSDSPGNDLGGITNSTKTNCETKCNSMDNCAGYVFDNRNNVCYPKNKNMYPVGSKNPLNNVDLYIRQPSITTFPGSSKTTSYVDSIRWQNYKNTGKPVSSTTFGTSGIVNSAQRQALDQLTGRLNLLASQITEKTNSLLSKNIKVNDQLSSNKTNFTNSATDFNAITSMDQSGQLHNINEIVKDSDIVVLQENSRYLVWSILAVGVVSLSLNILKKD
uniref:Apple domain-containing protein n=1 Tax=viral metagenome TaxID=1070528 RepID=A0A6C0DTD3_9ZZZZ